MALGAAFDATSTVAQPLPAGHGSWVAQVEDLSTPSGDDQRAFVRLRAAPGTEPAATPTWRVYAWLPRYPALVPGDLVTVEGQVDTPPADAPGFSGFLASRAAAGTLKAVSLELLEHGSGVRPAVEQLRWSIDELLSRALPEPEAGLAAGILVGLRERVSRAVADDFTTTGLTHVVAISGWNIALVAGIATSLLRATGLGRRPRSLLVMAAIVGYTLLAGAEASVVRAAVMGGVVLLAREGGRPADATAALGLACWCLLLVDPAMVTDIGLQLSLAATAGLLALGGPAEAGVRRLAAGRAPRWFCETLGVSLAAQLATLPLILFHFGRLSLISPLANLLVAPVVPLAMLGAFVGALLGLVLVAPAMGLLLAPAEPPRLAAAGSHGAWRDPARWRYPSRASSCLARWVWPAPGSPSRRCWPACTWWAGARSGSAAAAGIRDGPSPRPPGGSTARGASKRRRLAAISAGGLLLAVLATILVARQGVLLRVSVLDIGQGDAILVEASGGQRMLVDGGPDPDLLVRRLDERIPLWDRHIDLVVLTHPHEDHAAGLAGLTPRYRIDRIAETGMASEGAGVRALRTIARERGIARVRLVQGDDLRPRPRARRGALASPRGPARDRALDRSRHQRHLHRPGDRRRPATAPAHRRPGG